MARGSCPAPPRAGAALGAPGAPRGRRRGSVRARRGQSEDGAGPGPHPRHCRFKGAWPRGIGPWAGGGVSTRANGGAQPRPAPPAAEGRKRRAPQAEPAEPRANRRGAERPERHGAPRTPLPWPSESGAGPRAGRERARRGRCATAAGSRHREAPVPWWPRGLCPVAPHSRDL